MSTIRIFHNPRCSKSRQTLQLLNDAGHQPEIVDYLKNPPSEEEISELVTQLGFESARQLMRKGEQEFKDQKLADSTLTEQQLISAMANTPKLIERPIVITEKGARLGRPPESVMDIL